MRFSVLCEECIVSAAKQAKVVDSKHNPWESALFNGSRQLDTRELHTLSTSLTRSYTHVEQCIDMCMCVDIVHACTFGVAA